MYIYTEGKSLIMKLGPGVKMALLSETCFELHQ